MALRKTLQRVQLRTGNWVAIALLAGSCSFAAGWVGAFYYLAMQCNDVM